MTPWSPILLPLAVTAAWLWIPGLLGGLALRLRPCVLWAMAPLLSIAGIVLSSLLLPLWGVGWGPVPVGLVCTALVAALWMGRLLGALLRRRRRTDELLADPAPPEGPMLRRRGLTSRLTSIGLLTLLSLVISGCLLARQLAEILGAPDAISQSFDNIFHQSAVRHLLDGGNPSSLQMLDLTAGPGEPTFYPGAWHDIVSLVLLTLGSSDIPLATNALVAVVCAMIWPAGIILLTRTALPSTLLRWGILPAGVLAASVPQFPLRFVHFGVLYPNLLGFALLPAMLVLVMVFLGLGPRAGIGRVAIVVLGLLGAIAMSLAHPNASMALIALSIPLAVVAAARAIGRAAHPRSRRGWPSAVAVVLLAAGIAAGAVALWPLIRPPEKSLTWKPIRTVPEAIGEAITLTAAFDLTPWILVLLLLLGAYAAVRRRRPEMLLALAVATFLWVVAAAWPVGEARTAIVGVWYNDPHRLPPMLAIPAVPLMTLGAAHLARSLRPRRRRVHLIWFPLGALAAAGILALTQPSAWMADALGDASQAYTLDSASRLLTADEKALIDELPSLLPEDAVVVTSSWNGSSLAYPLAGVPTTTHHVLEHDSPEDELLDSRLREAAQDPAVCRALEDLGARYVLDFGPAAVDGSERPVPGMTDLQTAEGFTEIASEGEAVLYRIDACAP